MSALCIWELLIEMKFKMQEFSGLQRVIRFEKAKISPKQMLANL